MVFLLKIVNYMNKWISFKIKASFPLLYRNSQLHSINHWYSKSCSLPLQIIYISKPSYKNSRCITSHFRFSPSTLPLSVELFLFWSIFPSAIPRSQYFLEEPFVNPSRHLHPSLQWSFEISFWSQDAGSWG